MTSPRDGSTPAIAFQAVHKQFQVGGHQVRALAGLSLTVPPGGITGLIGPDGAGKTTLMRIAAGLMTVDQGSVRIFGVDAQSTPRLAQSLLGYMPQRFGLYQDLTVQENLDLFADLQGVPPAVRSTRYSQLMQMTRLGRFRGRLAGKLSGGMKQKLGLACTLVRAPELLLLDEPTVGVDPVSRRELWQIINHYVQDEGTTVLLSTAYLDEAERCGRVVVISQGQVKLDGTPAELKQPVTGRVVLLQVPREQRRKLVFRLLQQPSVVDAVVVGDEIRVVVKDAPSAQLQAILPDLPAATLREASPRFEDAFVDMLRPPNRRRERLQVLEPEGRALEPRQTDHSQDVVQVQNVTRRFGDFIAVKNVSFSVRKGEIFGLLGANGAGKTTTFRMLCGLLPPSSGTLIVAGVDVRRTAAAARARIGYMSQKFSLYEILTVAENLRFFSQGYGLRGALRQRRVQWALTQLELQSVKDVPSRSLSLGYKQRLALACALMHQPQILFLDEPTSGVDPIARREFWLNINAVAMEGVTVLVTTHFMEEAEYCDRLAVMSAGQILSIGSPAEIKHSAATPDIPSPTLEDAFIQLIEAGANNVNGAA